MALLLASSSVHGFADVSFRAPEPLMQAGALRSNDWNPQGIDVPLAIPEYVKNAPAYLDGSLVGDGALALCAHP